MNYFYIDIGGIKQCKCVVMMDLGATELPKLEGPSNAIQINITIWQTLHLQQETEIWQIQNVIVIIVCWMYVGFLRRFLLHIMYIFRIMLNLFIRINYIAASCPRSLLGVEHGIRPMLR